MLKAFVLAAILALVSGTAAIAACPSQVPGSTIEAIQANEQRILCLLQEVEAATRQRKYEADLRALQNSIQNIQLQQRFDALPTFTVPAPFAPLL
ncbi:hypothetical protein [Devosia sp.]|uniref:hypothetical protein n=1 Tax=Devosia sp. TaxID=1871048 RepID=UPI002FCB81BC